MGGYLICLCCFYLILVINTTSDVDFNTIISYALNLQESNISYSYRSCIFILPEKCRGYFCKTRLYDKWNREIFFCRYLTRGSQSCCQSQFVQGRQKKE